MADSLNFGEKLRKIRKDKHMSQTDLAGSVGVDPTFISKLELGQRLPSLPVLLKLSRALDIPIEELLQDTTPAASK